MKLAVFDIDGTLTLGDGLGTRCFFGAFDEIFGAGIVDRRLETYTESTDTGIAMEAARRALGRAPAEAELERFKAAYLARLETEIARATRAYRPVAGADLVLGLLASRPDWHVAIATGNWRRAASLKLECARIAPPPVAACSEDGLSRSAVLGAAVTLASAARGGERFDRVVYVGDQPWDLAAARQQGAAFLGIGTDARRHRLEQQGARVVENYETPDHFLSLLEEIAAARP
jgi:phosphoglycolate phosphatase-like HAD superfamily hydrolase